MQFVTTRQASQLTGLSTEKLREWTSRRALIPADVKPKRQGSPAKYTWQTILLLRIAVTLRNRFHLELQAHRELFVNLRRGLKGTSFIALWGKSLAIHGDGAWSLVGEMETGVPEGDAILIRLACHLDALSVVFSLFNNTMMPGQLDLFPARRVAGQSEGENSRGHGAAASSGAGAKRRRSA